METFKDLDHFIQVCGGDKKSDRIIEAIETAPTLSSNITYSIGDSLTYLIRRRFISDDNVLLASRRYQTILYVLRGRVDISYENINVLEAINEYSDLNDQQSFTGQTKDITFGSGTLVVFDIDEAYKIQPSRKFTGIILRVTIEGRSFHNK